MLSVYPACFFKEDNGYSVIFPDLDNLATCGESLEDAVSMAVDCLAGYLFMLSKDNTLVPCASDVCDIDINKIANYCEVSPAGSFVNLISVDVNEYAKSHFEKSVKKTLTIPAWLNTAALEQNINFSQVLQDALKEKLNLV